MSTDMNNLVQDPKPASHYYGDAVRRFFVAGTLVMMVAFPFFADLIPVSMYISLGAMILIGLAAGLTNPQLKLVAIVNVPLAVGAFAVFEYFAIMTYQRPQDYPTSFFLINQLLAVNFFLAAYASVKTVRGFYISHKEQL